MLTKIISGGQTGADRAGLQAAKDFGIATGGTAAVYYMTENGKDLSLRDKFDLISIGDSYKYRTTQNIIKSDGTVIFGNVSSPGSKLTFNECQRKQKPVIINPSSQDLVKWIIINNISILNVAGNRLSVNPGVYDFAYNILSIAFHLLHQQNMIQFRCEIVNGKHSLS